MLLKLLIHNFIWLKQETEKPHVYNETGKFPFDCWIIDEVTKAQKA